MTEKELTKRLLDLEDEVGRLKGILRTICCGLRVLSDQVFEPLSQRSVRERAARPGAGSTSLPARD